MLKIIGVIVIFSPDFFHEFVSVQFGVVSLPVEETARLGHQDGWALDFIEEYSFAGLDCFVDEGHLDFIRIFEKLSFFVWHFEL